MTWLVVGLGNADRGDDAVGPVVAAGIAGLGMDGVDVLVHEDPTGLLDLWLAYDGVVVVDAIRTGAPPGTIVTMEVGPRAGPVADKAWARTGRGGTHAFGLAAAIELGRALGRLPDRLVVVGVEVAVTDHRPGLSREVHRALHQIQSEVVAVTRTSAAQAPLAASCTLPPRAQNAAPSGARVAVAKRTRTPAVGMAQQDGGPGGDRVPG
ncbi:hydrogenase maturation protease [Actinotalea sp.]|uniref:hydrogenase maturation protease n=1 Tax=Actinotalea sp. TaxID=1872145 RepID=UPI003566C200